jgi:hypothetical protein
MQMINLEQTNTHYLLTIPQSLKQRAKKISPRQWDPQRSVWVFPKNETTYSLLLEEFENDIDKVNITAPNNIKQAKSYDHLVKQIRDLKNDNKILEVKALDVESERDEYISIIERLTSEVASLNEQASSSNLEQDIKDISKKCAGNNPNFNKIIDGLEFGPYLPIEITDHVVKCLSKKINHPNPNPNFFDLIKEGEETGVLDQETSDYLHTLRKQRNDFAHGGVDFKARMSRVLLVITAASLAWSKLNCKPN